MSLGSYDQEQLVGMVRHSLKEFTSKTFDKSDITEFLNRKQFMIFMLMSIDQKRQWYGKDGVLTPAWDATEGLWVSTIPNGFYERVALKYLAAGKRTSLEFCTISEFEERIANPFYDKTYYTIHGGMAGGVKFTFASDPTGGILTFYFVGSPTPISASEGEDMDVPDPFLDILIVITVSAMVVGLEIDGPQKQVILQKLYGDEQTALKAAGLPLSVEKAVSEMRKARGMGAVGQDGGGGKDVDTPVQE